MPRDAFFNRLSHPVAIAEHVFDAVLRPSTPDESLGARIDDVDDESAGFVARHAWRHTWLAIDGRTVAILTIDLVDVDPLGDGRVIVNQQIRCR